MFRRLPSEIPIFLTIWLGTLAYFPAVAFVDPGSLWHVRVGELILQNRAFMHEDPFTFPFEHQVWIPQHWGGEVIMALAHKANGPDGVLAAFAGVIAFFFTWVYFRLRSNGMQVSLAVVFTALAYVTAAFHFFARPHLATIFFVGLTMAFILDIDRTRKRLWHLAWLFPLYILWTNIHGGTFGGCLMLGIAATGWTITWMLKKQSPLKSPQDFGLLSLMVAACGLSVLINPFGTELVRTWFKVVGSATMKEVVSEHMPLSLRNTAGQVVVLFGVVYAVVLAGVPLRQWRIVHAIPWVWFLLTLQSIRQGPLFAVSAIVAIADLWPQTRWHAYLLIHGDSTVDAPHKRARWPWVLASLLFVTLSFTLIANNIRIPLIGAEVARFEPMAVPVDLNDEVSNIPAGERIFNEANWGGYLIYFAPGRKIFMDDRFELCGDAWLKTYAEAMDNRPEMFDTWQKQYGFRWAFISVDDKEPTPMEKHIATRKDFALVKRGKAAALYKLKNPP